jgi:hypothetical protein
VGDSIVIDGVRVTLIDARRLTREEYRVSGGNLPDAWLGGGLHLAFVVENRPSQPIPPVLGQVQALFNAQPYNAVTNATSAKPFAPFIKADDLPGFFASPYGRSIRHRVDPRTDTIAIALEVFLRGDAIPSGATGVVALEQGATRVPTGQGEFGSLGADQIAYHWFRFRLPALN